MKTFISLIVAVVLIGCTTSQQTKVYNTLYTTEQSVVAAVDAYDTLVINGTLTTNAVPQVSKVFNDFQAAMRVAVVTASYNTNAITPPALAVEAQSVINLINTIEKGTK